MQVCQDLDDISVLELYREYQGTIAAAVDFILIYEDDAVLFASDQPRDQGQVALEHRLVQDELLFLGAEQCLAPACE